MADVSTGQTVGSTALLLNTATSECRRVNVLFMRLTATWMREDSRDVGEKSWSAAASGFRVVLRLHW